jgi:phosphoglycolate phosphatase-like HAD superfamily hydrolase
MVKTVIFDFDGVIHSYKSGWKGADIIPDAPVLGIQEEIKKIRDTGYKVVVVSTRCYQDGGIEAIKQYLKNNNIEVDDVTGEKPPAIVQIDDRCICFDGQTEGLLEKIENFKSWNK